MKTQKEMIHELWYEKGYDLPYLNKISISELKGVYYSELVD